MKSVRRHATQVAVLVAAAVSTSSCTLLPHPGADAKGRMVHSLYIKIAILALIVLVGVIATLIFEIVAFRKRKGDDTLPIQDHGRPLVYGGFFLIGLVLVAILFPTSELTLSKVDRVAKHPDLTVTVTGSQWQWAATYEQQNVTVTGQSYKKAMEWELPVNKTAKVLVKATDVMHGLFLPQFNYDLNAVPGITNTFSFTPDRLGTYPGQCNQLCGDGHYQMAFVLKIVTQNEFDTWVHQQQQAAKTQNCPAASTQIDLEAHNVAWNLKCISVPPGQPFTLTMKNEDDGITHNFSVYDGPDTKTNLFTGPKFSGVATRVLHVSGLPAGTYYFQCDVHGAAMSGTVLVGKENG